MKKSSAALVLWALLIVSIQAASGQTDTIILLDLPESEYTLKVYRVSDGRWTDIAGRAFSGGRIHRPILQRDSGNRIYVSFLDPEGLSVMRFDGRTWSLVGGSKIPTSTVYYDFKIDRTDRPVVVFEEKDLSGRLTGMAFEGGRWSILGRRGFTDGPNAKEMHLAFDGGNRAHVLHGTFDFGSNRYEVRMSVFDGNAWIPNADFLVSEELSGSPGITDYVIGGDGMQYIAYGFQRQPRKNGLRVLSLDGDRLHTLVDERNAPGCFNPAVAVNGQNRVFVLCSAFDGQKNDRVLRVIQPIKAGISELKLGSNRPMTYSYRSNLALDAAGRAYFLYSRFDPSGEASVDLVRASGAGGLEAVQQQRFRNFKGMSAATLVARDPGALYVGLLFFR